MNRFRFVTVGGSVSTGSTPLIDMLREYTELKVVEGEFRPGDYLYELAANFYKGLRVNTATFNELKQHAVNYGDRPTLPLSVYYKILIRLPGPVVNMLNRHVSDMSRLMFAKRGYEKRVPGYKAATGMLFERLADLDSRLDKLSREQRTTVLTECLEQFFDMVSTSYVNKNTGQIPVFDQMVNPNKLFSKPGEMIMARLLPTVAIIVVTRDVRDQYCDMIRKGKKRYHQLEPAERVDRYINEYNRRYGDMHRQLKDLPENVLHVRFEDLIFHYQDTKKRVEEFLGIQEHRSPRKHFDPLFAAKNTMLYRKHENREEIAKIEQSMGQWLYPFESVTVKSEVPGTVRIGES